MLKVDGRRRVAANSLAGTTLHVVQIAMAFFMSPLIVKTLGDTVYGIWEIMIAFVGYFGILDVGVGPAIVRYIAVADRQRDRTQMSQIVSSSGTVLLGVGVLALCIMTVIASDPGRLININQSGTSVGLAAMMLGVTLLIRFFGTTFDSYYRGRQYHYLLYALRAICTVLPALYVWYGLTYTEVDGLLVVSASQLGGNLLYYGVVMGVFFFSSNRVPMGPQFVSRKQIASLYHFGVKSMLLMVSDRLRRSSMPLVVGYALGVNQVVFFALADKVVTYASQFAQVLGLPMTPYFSSLSNDSDREEMQREWLDLSRYLQVVQFGLAAGVTILGGPFLARWMGPRFAEESQLLIWLLGIGFLFQSISSNSGRLLVSLARHERAVKILMPTNIIVVFVAWMLATIFGLAGIGVALLLGSMASSALLLNVSCREIGISVCRYLRETTVCSIPPLVAITFFLMAINNRFEVDSYMELLIVCCAAALVYLSIAWFTSINSRERNRLLSVLRMRPRHGA